MQQNATESASADIGPEDPTEVEEEAELAARARESDRLLRRAMTI
jgi:hypothetical protein